MKLLLILAVVLLAGTERPAFIKGMAVVLAALLAVMLVMPQPATAQVNLLGGLNNALASLNNATRAIQDFINNVMRPILESIRSASSATQGFLTALRNLFEQIVWPVAEINRIRTLILQWIALLQGPLGALYDTQVHSAQLPNPRQLEAVMRNRSAGDFAALRAAFERTYGSLPAANEAHAQERNLVDIDDAMAVGHLMALKRADAGGDRTMVAADALARHGLVVAPGTAAFGTATAHIATLQSNAHVQKMIASALRQEAARLAHETVRAKRHAAFVRETRANAIQINR